LFSISFCFGFGQLFSLEKALDVKNKKLGMTKLIPMFLYFSSNLDELFNVEISIILQVDVKAAMIKI